MIAQNTIEKEKEKNEVISQDIIGKLSQQPDISDIELIALYSFVLQNKFHIYLYSVTPSANTVFKHQPIQYNNWHEELNNILINEKLPFIDAFAISKYCLENIFLQLTERGYLEFTYSPQALLTSKMLQGKLEVSRSTIARYVEAGMEIVPGHGHRVYPEHNVFYWNNSEWSTRIQRLYQTFKVRNRTKNDLINELKEEIKKYENKYNNKPFSIVFGHVTDPYELDEPDDYYEWKDLIEELEELNE